MELNIYNVAADVETTGSQIESQCCDLVAAVKKSVSIPIAVKIGPYFSAMANMAKRLAEAGADGLVLFNRFIQPDIDLDEMQLLPELALSGPHELLVPLRWVAILYGQVDASLALTTGVHSGEDVLKAVMAGADIANVCSVLLKEGVGKVGELVQDLETQMEKNGFDSIESIKGTLSLENYAEPAAFERASYLKMLNEYRL